MAKTQSSDTTEDAENVRFDILRRMSFPDKAHLVRELTLGVQRLAFAGLRERYPDASDDEIWLRLAARRLGRETVRKVYGWDSGDE